jgi:hypothetical protein
MEQQFRVGYSAKTLLNCAFDVMRWVKFMIFRVLHFPEIPPT